MFNTDQPSERTDIQLQQSWLPGMQKGMPKSNKDKVGLITGDAYGQENSLENDQELRAEEL